MQKFNPVLIITIVISIMLMAPLAFGLSTVSISDNSVQLVKDTKGGITFDDEDDTELVITPDTVNGYPGYRIEDETMQEIFYPWAAVMLISR